MTPPPPKKKIWNHWIDGILGDPGAVSGGRGKLSPGRINNKIMQRKAKNEQMSLWEQTFLDSVPNRFILASDWLHNLCLFFCPIREQQDQDLFRVFWHGQRYMKASCLPCLSVICCGGFFVEKSSSHSTKCSGNPLVLLCCFTVGYKIALKQTTRV